MTGRIANRLNLKGPNFLIDAACSSSLLAVQAAMQELRSGRSRLMLAGGVNASTPAEAFMIFCQLGALSRQSRIRPFDTAADGTLLGEGLGIVVLKRLEDAKSDGDRVYAVLKEVGQASDGRGLGLLAPRLEGEALAIERAYRQSGIDPDSITLIEAHGTGIPLGDQTEINALRQVMPDRNGRVPHCALGSVKSMICHCIPAAGVAGLIKTAMALHYRVLPPTLCETINPDLELETTAIFINTEARPWIHSPRRPRRAGINAFGFGGINTHAILEESDQDSPEITLNDWSSELAVFAASDRRDLLSQLDRVTGFISGRGDSDLTLGDVVHTLTEGIEEGPVRLALVANGLDDLVNKIERARSVLADEMRRSFKTRDGTYFRDRPLGGKLAFVFPGEGCQYRGMLGELALVFASVRRWFDFWDGLYDVDPADRPSAVVFPPPNSLEADVEARLESRLNEVAVGSESVFIACQALLELLSDLGVRPDAMVGHSSGENSALIAAGVVKLDSDERQCVEGWRITKVHDEEPDSRRQTGQEYGFSIDLYALLDGRNLVRTLPHLSPNGQHYVYGVRDCQRENNYRTRQGHGIHVDT